MLHRQFLHLRLFFKLFYSLKKRILLERNNYFEYHFPHMQPNVQRQLLSNINLERPTYCTRTHYKQLSIQTSIFDYSNASKNIDTIISTLYLTGVCNAFISILFLTMMRVVLFIKNRSCIRKSYSKNSKCNFNKSECESECRTNMTQKE